MIHPTTALVLGAAAFVAVLGVRVLTTNRLIKRKLRLSLVLIGVFLAITLVFVMRPLMAPEVVSELRAIERLAMAAALINALVFLLVNPLREDRVPDHFPTILQDAIVIGLVLASAMFLSTQLVTTSAVSAVVLGFALQDTLGNAFAGLAIQSERPFHVGHWVSVGEHEGRVTEVTWRATKLRTKNGNFVVLPNNMVSKEAIINYSEPTAPTRIQVEVGASYLVPPNTVKSAIMEAMQGCAVVLPSPAPDVVLLAFDASSITYRARFWIQDFERDERARSEVRTAIFYAFQRHDIEIPWPIQVEYKGSWPQVDAEAQHREVTSVVAANELFGMLDPALRDEIVSAAAVSTYGDGEPVVRQGQAGQSMFIILRGEVSVVIEPSRQEVARIPQGGYFGEMSLLTGEPRTATVLAVGDTRVIEIGADLFRRLAAAHPAAVEQIGVRAVTRRTDLERVKTAATGVATVEKTALLARMKKFLRIG